MADKKRLRVAVAAYANLLKGCKEFLLQPNKKKSQVKLRLQELITTHAEFSKQQLKLEELVDGDDDAKEAAENRNEITSLYYEVRATLEDEMEEFKKNQPKSEIQVAALDLNFVPHLPELRLEIFDGSQDTWQSFYEGFMYHVHSNQRLASITKFQYLKNSLRAPASRIVENLDFTPANYEVALDLLRGRYNKTQLRIEHHINELFNIKSVSTASSSNLLEVLDKFNSHLRSLNSIGRKTEHWDDLLVHMMLSKLDGDTKAKWRELQIDDQIPTWHELSKFIESYSHRLAVIKEDRSTVRRQESKSSFIVEPSMESTCDQCKTLGHSIVRCPLFNELDVEDRRKQVEKLKLCYNCLKHHQIRNCTSKFKCRTCNKRHHSLLHNEKVYNSLTESSPSSGSSIALSTTTKPKSECMISFNENQESYVFLATAMVGIMTSSGRQFKARALLDSGSQLNLISDSLASKIGVNHHNTKISIKGIGGTAVSTLGTTKLQVHSIVNEFIFNRDFHVVKTICSNQPAYTVSINQLQIPRNIQLADPLFFKNQEIDLLLGADIFFDLQSVGQIHLGKDLPILQNTTLGWVVSGKILTNNVGTYYCGTAAIEQNTCTCKLNELVKGFWITEAIQEDDKQHIEHDPCEQHFIKHFSRDHDGRFTVKLPFKQLPSKLGDSQVIAKQRWFNMEKRFRREPDLKAEYNQFMQEYIELGHMEVENQINNQNFYMPHHAVLRPNSSTTKLRVVFDGSANSSSNISLNDLLYTGNVPQADLLTILLRFRYKRFVFTTDISKMYRQINIHTEDQRYQYIFWRVDEKDELRTYKLTTVTYGTAAAPFLATRCLYQLAIETQDTYPDASAIIKNNTYVDDILAGADSEKELLELKRQLTYVLNTAGMKLRKWCSNDDNLLKTVCENDQEKSFRFNNNEFVKTLGLYWNASGDFLSININLKKDDSRKVTKRRVLSEVAAIFDPLGLISPIVVVGKLILQELWKNKAHWDESLPMALHTKWLQFREEAQQLQIIKIPRHVFNSKGTATHFQLHGFADSSEKAYGAVVYVRYYTSNGFVTNLLCSRSRVAPIKKTTIPRLELCAAVLLSTLIAKVRKSLDIKINEFLWSDSTIVLYWIHSTSSQWKTFVSNRVSSIKSITNQTDWRHVKSKENPADIISRGQQPETLVNSELWWNGPTFLQLKDEDWNAPFNLPDSTNYLEEQLVGVVKVNTTIEKDIVTRCKYRNNYHSVIKVMSWICRFVQNVKQKVIERKNGIIQSTQFNTQVNYEVIPSLSVLERQAGLNFIIKIAQQSFRQEFKDLQSKGQVSHKSNIKNLNSFLDKDNILRVGGRLMNSNLPYNSKFPIILPYNHVFTYTLFWHTHRKLLHVGPQALLCAVRQNYWPIRARDHARQTYRLCAVCFKAKPKTVQQLMGNLPPTRVELTHPFVNVGVDYCGPFYIHYRIRGKRPTKAYIALFICFAIKAVHLELVSDLTTGAFIGALKRFISTRGLCQNIYSDNGTNFVGANAELQELYKLLSSTEHQNKITEYCKADNIIWHFQPPGSPNFGGLYEAGVKLVKFHLKRVMANASLTHEELYTLIKEVEAVVNSRPITQISDSPDDLQALTPGHFLIGRPFTQIPEPDISEEKISCLDRWRYVQQLQQVFWKRWSSEYLQSLQCRRRWDRTAPNLKLNQLVLIKDNNLPPMKWKLGRIIELHPGSDGLSRVFTLQTATGRLKRSITNICPFPDNNFSINPDNDHVDQRSTGGVCSR